MDDTHNGEYSRTPVLEDVISICDSLNKAGAKYIVIGGIAVIFHGFGRGTKDIDLLVDTTDKNVRRIKKALSILPDNAISQIKDDEVRQYSVVRIADEVVIDLMAKACGIDYEEAKQGIEWRDIQGVQIPIVNKILLIKMKDTIRPGDKMDVDFLKAEIEAERKKQP